MSASLVRLFSVEKNLVQRSNDKLAQGSQNAGSSPAGSPKASRSTRNSKKTTGNSTHTNTQTNNGTSAGAVAMTTISATNITTAITTSDDKGSASIGITIAIIITIICVIVLVVGLVYLLKRMSVFDYIMGKPLKRRSSTGGSSRPLEVDYPTVNHDTPDPGRRGRCGDRDDMFTIDDMEEDEFEERQDDREGYFYDEVFSPSSFQDERTKNSVRQLVSSDGGEGEEHQDMDEVLDFDFETLGIKIDNYRIDPSHHRNA